jgi:hypothetical protein
MCDFVWVTRGGGLPPAGHKQQSGEPNCRGPEAKPHQQDAMCDLSDMCDARVRPASGDSIKRYAPATLPTLWLIIPHPRLSPSHFSSCTPHTFPPAHLTPLLLRTSHLTPALAATPHAVPILLHTIWPAYHASASAATAHAVPSSLHTIWHQHRVPPRTLSQSLQCQHADWGPCAVRISATNQLYSYVKHNPWPRVPTVQPMQPPTPPFQPYGCASYQYRQSCTDKSLQIQCRRRQDTANKISQRWGLPSPPGNHR